MVILASTLSFSSEVHSNILESTGTHFIAYVPQCDCEISTVELLSERDEGFTANGVISKPIPTSISEDIESLSSVKDASPYLLFTFEDEETGDTITIGGFDPDSPISVYPTVCSPSHIIQGKFLTAEDTGKILLEKSYAVSRTIPVGFIVDIAGEDFVVAGIVEPGVRPGKADIYMVFSDALRVVNSRLSTPIEDEANIILVESASSLLHDQAVEDVQTMLGSESFVSTYKCYTRANDVLGVNSKMMTPLMIIIGIGVIGFAIKSQLSSVIERRRDIGIMKAIGWSDFNVISMIIGESSLQSIIGGVLGAFAAVLVIILVPFEILSGATGTTATETQVQISPLMIVIAIGLSLIGGIVAGIIPAIAAARTKPANSLRRL